MTGATMTQLADMGQDAEKLARKKAVLKVLEGSSRSKLPAPSELEKQNARYQFRAEVRRIQENAAPSKGSYLRTR